MILAFFLAHLVVLISLAATAYALGRLLSRRLAYPSVAAELGLATALGLGGLGLLGLGLGLVGLLNSTVLISLIVGIHLAALPMWRGWWLAWRRATARQRRDGSLSLLAGLVLLAPCLVLALYPPSAFDATMYHLPFAKLFADQGRVVFAPHLRYPVFPQLVDLLFSHMLLLVNDISAALVQVLSMLVVAVILFAWGAQTVSRRCGAWAAALWLGNPLVVWNARAAFVDVSLAMFSIAACYAFGQWFLKERHASWLLLSAACCGFAAGTKYHGLIFVAFFLVACAWLLLRRHTPPSIPWRRRLVAVAGAATLLMLIASPWYVRNYYYTGNPVFPLFSQVFGESEWSFFLSTKDATQEMFGSRADDDETLRLLTSTYEIPQRLARRVKELLVEDPKTLWLTPWRLSFQAQDMGRAPISPFYLLALPWIALLAWRDSSTRLLLVMSGAYGVLCLATAPDPRYLMPVLGLLALPAAAAVDSVLNRRSSPMAQRARRHGPAVVACLLLVAPGIAYDALKIHQLGPLPVNAEQREEHLSRSPRYRAISYLNTTFGDDYVVYALRSEDMVYHARGRLLGDHFGPARYAKVSRRLKDPPALHQELRSLGAEHFMVPACEAFFPPRQAEPALFELIYQQGSVCIYSLSDDSSV